MSQFTVNPATNGQAPAGPAADVATATSLEAMQAQRDALHASLQQAHATVESATGLSAPGVVALVVSQIAADIREGRGAVHAAMRASIGVRPSL